MREIAGDLWDYFDKPGFVICITTNGFVKKSGEAVMGRGCAKEATSRLPGIARLLGTQINRRGNVVSLLYEGVAAFPVKHKWWETADLALIERSARKLREWAVDQKEKTFVLPRPGCGNGRLKWEDVRKVLQLVGMPDNVWVIDRG